LLLVLGDMLRCVCLKMMGWDMGGRVLGGDKGSVWRGVDKEEGRHLFSKSLDYEYIVRVVIFGDFRNFERNVVLSYTQTPVYPRKHDCKVCSLES
jgi:hypothetical protein